MGSKSSIRPWLSAALTGLLLARSELRAQAPANGLTNAAMIVEIEGTVEVSRAGSPLWDPGRINQLVPPGHRGRTGNPRRGGVGLAEKTVLRKGPQTIIEIPEANRSGIR